MGHQAYSLILVILVLSFPSAAHRLIDSADFSKEPALGPWLLTSHLQFRRLLLQFFLLVYLRDNLDGRL